jgi:hypothetical protein
VKKEKKKKEERRRRKKKRLRCCAKKCLISNTYPTPLSKNFFSNRLKTNKT